MLAITILSIISPIILFLGFTKSRKLMMALALLGLVVSIYAVWINHPFGINVVQTSMSFFGAPKVFILLGLCMATILIPFIHNYATNDNEDFADFTGIFLFALVGLIMMVSFKNFMILFLGVEILSIAMYVLAGADRRSMHSNEAAIKYFIMGAFASAILLFGIALFYVSFHTLSIQSVESFHSAISEVSIFIILIGLSFKLSLAPFHFWSPDVYQGTPTIFTAIMSTVVKIAGFGALYRFISLQGEMLPEWVFWLIVLLALLSMVIGNIMALSQTSVKRLLAYSGIVQAGFIVISLLNIKADNEWPYTFYIIAYSIASLLCFLVVHFVEQQSGSDTLDSFAGLGRSNKSLAIVFSTALISLAGGPLTAGFLAKLFVLQHAASVGMISLVAIALVLAVISMSYYFKIINRMWAYNSADVQWTLRWEYTSILIVLAAGLLLLGVYPTLAENLFMK